MTQLLPINVSPHDFQAKPEDAQKLVKADVLIENGLGVEVFLDELVKNADNSNMKIIDSSKGVQTISTEAIQGKAGVKLDKAGHEEVNPHIWLDPKRAIHQVENIRDGLIAADPSGKEIYTANGAAYMQRLRELDTETTKMLQPFAGKTFVAFHDFAPYFAQSYNRRIPMTVDELVGLGWDRLGFQLPWANRKKRDRAVRDALARVNGSHLRTKLLGGLSGGETKRMLLAYCLVYPRRLLILDEAPAGLDIQAESEFYQLLYQLKQEQCWAILQISHDLDMVRQHCDRVLCINRTLRCQGTPTVALSPDSLSALYGKDFVRYHHSH